MDSILVRSLTQLVRLKSLGWHFTSVKKSFILYNTYCFLFLVFYHPTQKTMNTFQDCLLSLVYCIATKSNKNQGMPENHNISTVVSCSLVLSNLIGFFWYSRFSEFHSNNINKFPITYFVFVRLP